MNIVTAKELKNETGEILRQVCSGEKVLVTRRDKPCAIIERPGKEEKKVFSLRPFESAWKDILNTLKKQNQSLETGKRQ